MCTQDHLKPIQRYVANVAITPSVFRNPKLKDRPGFVSAARAFLCNLDLQELKILDPANYAIWLENRTQELMNQLPVALWGPARKAINVFMTMCLLNRYLHVAYELDHLRDAMEVPLDNQVEKKVRKFGRKSKIYQRTDFPKWKSIAELDAVNSKKYQQIAEIYAKQLNTVRGELDAALWEPPTPKVLSTSASDPV